MSNFLNRVRGLFGGFTAFLKRNRKVTIPVGAILLLALVFVFTRGGSQKQTSFQTVTIARGELTATVGATGTNPAFSVTFAERLVIGEQYSVKLWMDFDGSGACEAPPTDHQWSVPIPADFSTYQPTFTYTHNTNFTDVCSYFP